MKKITREVCLHFIKNFYKAKLLYLALVSVFAVLALWSLTKNTVIVICGAVFALLYLFWRIRELIPKMKNIPTDKCYLVEDEVVHVRKRLRLNRNSMSSHHYIYTFGTYGKYTFSKNIYPTIEIQSKKEEGFRDLQIEELSLQCREKGDIFYLLVCEENGKIQIAQCFPKHYFDVVQEDFNLIGGKYYCKD